VLVTLVMKQLCLVLTVVLIFAVRGLNSSPGELKRLMIALIMVAVVVVVLLVVVVALPLAVRVAVVSVVRLAVVVHVLVVVLIVHMIVVVVVHVGVMMGVVGVVVVVLVAVVVVAVDLPRMVAVALRVVLRVGGGVAVVVALVVAAVTAASTTTTSTAAAASSSATAITIITSFSRPPDPTTKFQNQVSGTVKSNQLRRWQLFLMCSSHNRFNLAPLNCWRNVFLHLLHVVLHFSSRKNFLLALGRNI